MSKKHVTLSISPSLLLDLVELLDAQAAGPVLRPHPVEQVGLRRDPAHSPTTMVMLRYLTEPGAARGASLPFTARNTSLVNCDSTLRSSCQKSCTSSARSSGRWGVIDLPTSVWLKLATCSALSCGILTVGHNDCGMSRVRDAVVAG